MNVLNDFITCLKNEFVGEPNLDNCLNSITRYLVQLGVGHDLSFLIFLSTDNQKRLLNPSTILKDLKYLVATESPRLFSDGDDKTWSSYLMKILTNKRKK